MRNIIDIHEPKFSVLYEAFPYQKEAFEAIKDLPYSAIFHEQGLGKTKIAVDLIAYWLEDCEIDTVLVVTKKQLIANWERELFQHLGIRPAKLDSNPSKNYYVLTSTARIIVTNFETVVSEHDRLSLFLDTRSVAIIIDESAKIKNPDTKISQTLFELSPQFSIKCIMTGTPIANRPYDIWSQIFFLDNGKSLGANFEDFKKNVDLTNDLASDEGKRKVFSEAVGSIFEKISTFSVRETKDSSLTIELPSKTIHDIAVDPEDLQNIMYEQVRHDMCIVVQQGDESIFDDSSSSLKRMGRLLEIASSPRIIDDSYDRISGKEKKLDDLIKDIVSRGEKCIVWSSFIKNVDEFCSKYQQYNSVKIHGGMNMESRNRSVEEFQNGDASILFATPQAAKEGLTLTAANNAIFYDRGFNLDDYLQAQDRIHRISQTRDCHIFNLILRDSIDVWISKLLSAKRNAALLGQGDIDSRAYEQIADYSYCDLVKDVLGYERKNYE